jgi:hypothetical protein
MITLEEIKSKIKIASAVPDDNKTFQAQLMEDEDCFGKDYQEDGEHCKECIINTHYWDKDANPFPQTGMLKVFCKRFTNELLAVNGEKNEIELLKDKIRNKLARKEGK